MAKASKLLIGSLSVSVKKNFYDGLWYIKYDDGGVWAGPFKTKKEACERLEREKE